MPKGALNHTNLFAPDFIISALFCDKKGMIYDFSGYGVDGFHNKRLQTIQKASSCFAQDPIRLLRAIKYMVIGY